MRKIFIWMAIIVMAILAYATAEMAAKCQSLGHQQVERALRLR